MRQDYFTYQGKRYESGNIIVMHIFNVHSRSMCHTKCEFLYYDTTEDVYVVKVYGGEKKYKSDLFFRCFCYNYNEIVAQEHAKYHNQNQQLTFSKELNVDGLFIAWMWYVFIMVIAIIFKDCIGIWILASVVFFNYRNKKLKEAGYK